MREADLLACKVATLHDLLKGYPEFSPDQPRDAGGRWSRSAGNTGIGREPRSARERTGKKPSLRTDRSRTRRQREQKRINETREALDKIKQATKDKTEASLEAAKEAAEKAKQTADDLRSGQTGLDEAKKTLDWLGIGIRAVEMLIAMKIGGLIGGPWGELGAALLVTGTWIYEWYDNRQKRLAREAASKPRDRTVDSDRGMTM
jgi:hypothetical protein